MVLKAEKDVTVSAHTQSIPAVWNATTSLKDLVQFAFVKELWMSGLLRFKFDSNLL